MEEYRILSGPAETEFVEKRSRFIGQVQPVQTEEEARAFLEQVRKKHHDARHNCWCYLLRGSTARYSDDGEPQGTAGRPMLEVFQRESVTDLCCVVTRYFGGILLGTGGLLRAYTRAAGDALQAAGISVQRVWAQLSVPCPYSLYDRIRSETEKAGGVIADTAWSADVVLTVLLPAESADAYCARLTELSAGKVSAAAQGTVLRAVPLRYQ